jgi:DNA-binding CsgD family transcriptional regulator
MSEGLQALTEREKETLRLLLGGHDIKSIAARLGLSVHTVNERLREARRKLGASSSRQAARLLADAEHGGHKFSGDPHFSGDRDFGVAGGAVRASHQGHSHRPAGRGRTLAWLGGGMLIMSLLIAAVVISAALHGGEVSAPAASAPGKIVSSAPDKSESASSALAWLALGDDQRWTDSWSAAGAAFKAHITADGWAARAQPVRTPLGRAFSRVLKTVTKATVLPGVPEGQYEILQFATTFQNRSGMIETVTLDREGSAWKVIGYFITLAPPSAG